MEKIKAILGGAALIVALAVITSAAVTDENQNNVISYWGVEYGDGFDICLRNEENTTQECVVTIYKQGEEVWSFVAMLPANSRVTYPVEVEIHSGRYAVGVTSNGETKFDAICLGDRAGNATTANMSISYLGINYDDNRVDIRLTNKMNTTQQPKVIIFRRKVEVCNFTAFVPQNTEVTFSVPVETSRGGVSVGLDFGDGIVKESQFAKLHCPKQ